MPPIRLRPRSDGAAEVLAAARTPERSPEPEAAAERTTERDGRLRALPWFEPQRLAQARVLLIGVGALGNETLKNLALFGVGHIAVCDSDRIEPHNLSRSALFTPADVGRSKAEVAAEAARRIHPGIDVRPLVLDATWGMGTAAYGAFDAVICAVDSREARLRISRACWKMGTPMIDGALDVLAGVVRVFDPPESACYGCTLSEADWRALPRRTACGLLESSREVGGAPTTAISAAIVGAMQVQELLKRLLPRMPGKRLAGQGYAYDGVSFEPMLLTYPRKADEDCGGHDRYETVHRLTGTRHLLSIGDLLAWAQRSHGLKAVRLVLERDVVQSLSCPGCGHTEPIWRADLAIRDDPGPCPGCGVGARRRASIRQSLDPAELDPDRSIASLGLPPMDIITLSDAHRSLRATPQGDSAELLPTSTQIASTER